MSRCRARERRVGSWCSWLVAVILLSFQKKKPQRPSQALSLPSPLLSFASLSMINEPMSFLQMRQMQYGTKER